MSMLACFTLLRPALLLSLWEVSADGVDHLSLVSVLNLSDDVLRVFMSKYGEDGLKAVVAGNWAVVPATIITGYSDMMYFMDYPKCEHYKDRYMILKNECMEIYDQAVRLKKKAMVLMGAGIACAHSNGTSVCNQSEFFSGSGNFCPQVLHTKKQLGKLASTEQNHTKMILKTAEASGYYGRKHAVAGFFSAGAAWVVGTACYASGCVSLNPAIWGLCAITLGGGVGGGAANMVASSQFYHDQTELNKLEQQCSSYMHDIQQMETDVFQEYANLCIEGEIDQASQTLSRNLSETSSAELIEKSEHQQLGGDDTLDPYIHGHDMIDPAVKIQYQNTRVRLYMAESFICLALLVILKISWMRLRIRRSSETAVDPQRLLGFEDAL